MVSGKRVRQARELRGLTQTELADKIRVSQGLVADIERGFKGCSENLVAEIATHTKFPISFFYNDPAIEFSPESLLFRARADMTRRRLTEACRYAEIVFEVFQSVTQLFEPLVLTLPHLPSENPKSAASKTRHAFGIDAGEPIQHLTYLVERSGIVVLAMPVSLEKQDAFAFWIAPDLPAMALAAGKPGDRLRFSIAHELGHLVMVHSTQYGIEEEEAAHKFAAELLMPERAMRREIAPPVTLSRIAELKPKWGVSIQALVKRAADLGIISHRQYRYLFEQLSSKGWRTQEPSNLEVIPERPMALRQMAEAAYGNPINYSKMAADTNLRVELLRQIVEGYTSARPEIARPSKVVAFKRA